MAFTENKAFLKNVSWNLTWRHAYNFSTWMHILYSYMLTCNTHYKHKTVSWLSYFYNGNPNTWKDCLYTEMGPWLFQSILASTLERLDNRMEGHMQH